MRHVVLVGLVACSSSGGVVEPDAGIDASSADADASVTPARGECGMPSYQWLPAAQVGGVLEDDPQGTVTVAGAQLLRIALASNGLTLHRAPDFATRLHHIRYQTQDRGQLIDATAMVVLPEVDTAQNLPVLLYLHGTTGLNDSCAPSANLDDSESDNYKASLLLSMFASYGYIVVAPDYIGLKSLGAPSPELHPYLVAEATAIASLDAVRAARALATQLGSNVMPGKVAVWGASQGGHAAAFTVHYAPQYAPELEIAAGVYAIPPLDLAAQWRRALTALGDSTGFIVMAYTAMARWYERALSSIFVPPLDAVLPTALAASCKPDTLDAITSIDQVFASDVLDHVSTIGLDNSPWSCIVAANSLPTASATVSDVPALVILGENDPVVDPAIERANFNAMCARGANWSYLECSGTGHGDTFAYSIDNALDFISARIAGDPLTGACTVRAAETCRNAP
jgi:acetyl esterase/lipase